MAKEPIVIGLKDLRENTENYVSQVKKGKSFLVVRRSKPIFRLTPVDKWGDEGEWETVIDFSKIKKGGVPAETILKHLRAINEADR